jgi:hypothetical protein
MLTYVDTSLGVDKGLAYLKPGEGEAGSTRIHWGFASLVRAQPQPVMLETESAIRLSKMLNPSILTYTILSP